MLTNREKLLSACGSLGTGLLRLLPAEMAHDFAMNGLRRGWFDRFLSEGIQRPIAGVQTKIPGLGTLAHPVGLAAGFDKNCVAPKAFAKMGFSYLEIGTVTPLSQEGNPKPRMFRLPDQRGLINRMGFNSEGVDVVSRRLRDMRWNHDQVPLGVNVGKNKLTAKEKAHDDYLRAHAAFRDLGHYFVFNLSSPNTPGLRDLANRDFLSFLAQGVGDDGMRCWIKLDPDRTKKEFQDLVSHVVECGFRGLILGNTAKISQPEEGGLSGHPLAIRSTTCLEWAHEVTKGQVPLIGCGGILSGVDVFEKLARGASAVQLYTALVYRGPWAVARIVLELADYMHQQGFESVDHVIGSFYERSK